MSSCEFVHNSGVKVFLVGILRAIALFVVLPFIILMNGCSLIMEEQTDVATRGLLTAKATLINPGAMSDYSGAVWVLPRFVPSVWPLDVLIGCRALLFDSDPRISLKWEGSALAIEHDQFVHPATKQKRCYGHAVVFRERVS